MKFEFDRRIRMKIKKTQKIVFILSIVIVVLSVIGLVSSTVINEVSKTAYILSHVNNFILTVLILLDSYVWYKVDITINANKEG